MRAGVCYKGTFQCKWGSFSLCAHLVNIFPFFFLTLCLQMGTEERASMQPVFHIFHHYFVRDGEVIWKYKVLGMVSKQVTTGAWKYTN